jgi:hypothetical protein
MSKAPEEDSFIILFKNKLLRSRFITLVIVGMVSNLAFDMVVRMSDKIGKNFFMTFALSSVIETPSMIVVTLILDR